jgi:hypothetical protein
MMLRRLLAEGVRPDWLVVEVWAPFLPQVGMFDEEQVVLRADWDWVDIPLLAHYYEVGWTAANNVLARHITPAIHYRQGLLNHYAPCLLPVDRVRELESVTRRAAIAEDDWGAYPAEGQPMTGERGEKMLAVGRYIMAPVVRNFRIHERSDEALHALLGECRDRGIKVVLFMMPEHSALRECYPPDMLTIYHDFLARLGRGYHVPIIDGRTWCADDEFSDIFHLLGAGARTFSERFGRDICQPLLDGRPLAKEVLFRDGRSTSP